MSKTIKINDQVKDELKRIHVDQTRRVNLSDFDDLENKDKKDK
jgi:hypothetical protein